MEKSGVLQHILYLAERFIHPSVYDLACIGVSAECALFGVFLSKYLEFLGGHAPFEVPSRWGFKFVVLCMHTLGGRVLVIVL